VPLPPKHVLAPKPPKLPKPAQIKPPAPAPAATPQIAPAVARVPIPAQEPAPPAPAGPPDSDARLVGGGKPIYPPNMVDQGREGTVKASCLVSATGEVLDCTLQEVQGGTAFGPAVLKFLLASHPKPTIRNGKPVQGELNYLYHFRLEE
jgi:protein TonB